MHSVENNCRLLAFFRIKRKKIKQLWSSIRNSAKNDFIAKQLGLGFHQHNDGLGYLMTCPPFKRENTIYKKYIQPAWEVERLSYPTNCDEMYGIFHVRKALNKAPKGIDFVQPINIKYNFNKIYIAITGGLKKEIFQYFNIKEPVFLMSDTQMYAYLIKNIFAKNLGKKSTLKEMAEIIHSLNKTLSRKISTSWCFTSAILGYSVREKGMFLVITRIVLEEELKPYCELYRVYIDEGIVFASSTTAFYLEQEGYKIDEIGVNTSVLMFL